ncbi:MAG: GNAT family N-acetyltransferase [Saprospiraceae bacterium]
MEHLHIVRTEESRIDEHLKLRISGLLAQSFPGYPSGRIYYRQLPSFRYLASEGKQLVGHLAVEHRMINAGGTPANIFGIIDLCVEASRQSLQIGTKLLSALEADARSEGIDFLVLISGEQGFYERAGFRVENNLCRWVSIGDHISIGLVQGRLPGSLLVKPLGGKKWGEGVVDFLGYMF